MTTSALAALFVVSSVVACGSSASEPPTTTVPFHAIPPDAVVVNGTATCALSSTEGVDPVTGGPGWRAVCELDMSDPRISGTEIQDRLRFVDGGEVGDVWVAEEATITNAGGTWRGIVQAADDGWPSGEAHYVGEDGYEGLEFHYYFGVTESDDPEGDGDLTDLKRGWISGSN